VLPDASLLNERPIFDLARPRAAGPLSATSSHQARGNRASSFHSLGHSRLRTWGGHALATSLRIGLGTSSGRNAICLPWPPSSHIGALGATACGDWLRAQKGSQGASKRISQPVPFS